MPSKHNKSRVMEMLGENRSPLIPGVHAQREPATADTAANGNPPVTSRRNKVVADATKPLVVSSARDVYQSEYKEPEPIIRGLLYPGLTIFTARPKAGKSWFALQIAIAIVNDARLAGKFTVCKPGRVLYVALEESQRRTAPRLRKLTGLSDFLDDMFFVYEIDGLMGGGVAQIDQFLQKTTCTLVVIDTFFAFSRESGRKHQDILQADYNQINMLRKLAEKHNCGILLVHHSRKAAGETIDTVLGTTGFSAASDAIWNLRRKPEGDAILNVTGREMEETTYGLHWEAGEPFGWKVVAEGMEAELSVERKRIVELLRADGPQSPKMIATRLNKNPNTIRRLLQGLAIDRIVKKTGESYALSEEANEMNA